MKKILALLLVVILTATISISGTMAFVQAANAAPVDVETNTSNIKIDQQIYYREYSEGEETQTCTLRDDKTSKFVLYPAIYGNLEKTTSTLSGFGKHDMYEYPNVQDEIVVVSNAQDSTDAYVRTWIAIECGNMNKDEFEQTIKLNINETDWSWETKGLHEINGKKHYVLLATYNTGLAVSTTTEPSLLQVMCSKDAGNEHCAKLAASDPNNYELDILILSQAAQTESGDLKTDYSTVEKIKEMLSAAFTDELPEKWTSYSTP